MPSDTPHAVQPRVSRGEAIAVALIVAAGIGVNLLLLDPRFEGADAISYTKFAVDGQSLGYWKDPEAFYGTYFPMGYPALYALLLKASGSLRSMQVLVFLMASALPLVSWVLAYHLGRRVRLAVMAAVILSPSIWFLASDNGYETLISFSMCCALAVQWTAYRRGSRPTTQVLVLSALAGLAVGLSILASAPVMSVIPVLLVLAWKASGTNALTFAGGVIALPALWAVRNFIVMDRWSPLSTNGPLAFWHGNNWTTTNGAVQETLIRPPVGYDSLTSAALGFIKEQPEAAFSLLLKKAMRLLEPVYYYNEWPAPFKLLPHWYAIAFSAIGILLFAWFAFARFWAGSPPLPRVLAHALMVLSYFVFLLPFQAEPRYLTPLVPVAIVVAVATAYSAIDRARHRHVPSSTPMGVQGSAFI